MQEWSVRVQGRAPRAPDADTVLDALAPYSPAVSEWGDEFAVRLTVMADGADGAVRAALAALQDVWPGLEPVSVEAQTADELDRLLESPPAPVGV